MNTEISMDDKILSVIKETEPVKTSTIRRVTGIDSDTVRYLCETNDDIKGLKIRQCYVWSTKDRVKQTKKDILSIVRKYPDGCSGYEDVVSILGTNKMTRDYITAVIYDMIRDGTLAKKGLFTILERV